MRRKRLSITACVGGDMACNSASNLSRGSFSKRAERLTSKIQKSLFPQRRETHNGHFEGRMTKDDNLAAKVALALAM